MEAKAGQLGNALSLVRLGLELGAGGAGGGLDALAALLAELQDITRRAEGSDAGFSCWALELAEYEATRPSKQLRLLLQGSDESTIKVTKP